MNKSIEKAMRILSALFLSGFILCTSINFVMNFKPLYFFDVDYLQINKIVDMNSDEVKMNYSVLVNYLNSSENNKLILPSFELSYNTETHFTEVKRIFILNKNLMYILGIISAFIIISNLKNKDLSFLRNSAIILISFPVIISPLALSFNKWFTIFHKIFFKNDYWLIDPNIDPVINILPENFFLHCMIQILIFLLIASGVLFLLYKRGLRKIIEKY
jgi:integral membrane protein (TIGR01906 family)